MKTLVFYEPETDTVNDIVPLGDEAFFRILVFISQKAEGEDIAIKRFNIKKDPREFVLNKAVTQILQDKGQECLPLIFLNDVLIKEGGYPTDEELSAAIKAMNA